MAILTGALVILLYALAACAMCGALVAQVRFMQAAGLPLSVFLRKPWLGLTLSADPGKAFAAPGQVERFATFGLLMFAALAAMIVGRSIQSGHLPF